MAGDWIKMRTDLPEDPAVFKLAAIMKIDRHSIVGRLYAFWSWADKHAVDGRVDGASSQVVDAVVQFGGFAASLQAVKWLEIGDDWIQIPKHERHNGEPAKERSLKNQRQARWREGRRIKDATPSTQASTREEKRREEPKDSRASRSPLNGAFTAFWDSYPKKRSKGDAEKAWLKLKPDAALQARIQQSVARAAASADWGRDGGKYVPHPATWLNAKGWEDDIATGGADPFEGAT